MTQHVHNFADVEKILESKRPDITTVNWFFALEDMKQFMHELGDPQDKPSVIHVAGTSGKTSTCYYLAEFLRLAHIKAGLTVSPHVTDVGERIQIDGSVIEPSQYLKLFETFIQLPIVKSMEITYFGLLVAFAYWVIAREQLPYAVIEVGLGGRLDATNVINDSNKVCVITDIGLDHTQILGDTHEAIATEKAGIIQPSNHVFIAKQAPEIMHVFEETCKKQNATLHVMPDELITSAPGNLPLFQKRNWSLAKFAYDFVQKRDNLPELSQLNIEDSAKLTIPARMEPFNYRDQQVIIDVSHNGQKITALSNAISSLYPDKSLTVLLSMVSGKDTSLHESLQALHDLTENIIVTSFSAMQDMQRPAIDPSLIADVAKSEGFKSITVIKDPVEAFEQLILEDSDIKLVTGSFFLVNHIYPILKGNA